MTFKFNWGHGLFIFFVIFAIVMTGMAVYSSNQRYDLVSDDYYVKELAYQNTINETQNMVLYNEHPIVSVTSEGDISLALQTKEAINTPVKMYMTFYRPDDKNADFSTTADVTAQPVTVPIQHHAAGRWKLFLHWSHNGHSFTWNGDIDR